MNQCVPLGKIVVVANHSRCTLEIDWFRMVQDQDMVRFWVVWMVSIMDCQSDSPVQPDSNQNEENQVG